MKIEIKSNFEDVFGDDERVNKFVWITRELRKICKEATFTADEDGGV